MLKRIFTLLVLFFLLFNSSSSFFIGKECIINNILKQDFKEDVPDYIWKSKIILWGKNLKINNISYNGGKIEITSDGDLENPDFLEIYFDDEKCGSFLQFWVTPISRMIIPWFYYGKVVLTNFNGIIEPGFRDNSYIIKGNCFGSCIFYARN